MKVDRKIKDCEGVAQVVVTSGDEELVVLEEPTYEFEVRRDNIVESVGQKRFVIKLRDEDGVC